MIALALIKHDPEEGTKTVKVKGDLNNIVKQKVISVVRDEWDPEKKELMVFGDVMELEFNLPLTPEQYDVLSNFNMRKEGKVAVVELPYYVITYPKYSYPGAPQVVYMIVPYVDEEHLKEFEQMVRQMATEKDQSQ